MSLALTQNIYSKIDDRFYPIRVYHSIKSISKHKGQVAAFMTSLSLTVATITSLALSYFCLEGTVRSFIEAHEDETPINKIRPLGDAGGWISLALFSTIALKTLFESIVREGEYLNIKPICQKWINENKDLENSQLEKNLYLNVNELLDAFNLKCLFSKRLVTRRLTALEICQHLPKDKKKSKFSFDRKLQDVFKEIDKQLKEKTSCSRYFHRFYRGEKAIAKKSCSLSIISLIFGVVFPLIFITNAALSLVGEVGLGHDLFINRTGLADTGHFGEWPINAIEALSAAFLLHFWYILNEGDFVITRQIYAKELKKLENDRSLHNRLCHVANSELLEMSTVCYSLKYPTDYKFEKI